MVRHFHAEEIKKLRQRLPDVQGEMKYTEK